MIALGYPPKAVCSELSLSEEEVTAIVKNPTNKTLIEQKRTEALTNLGNDEAIVMNMVKTILTSDLTDLYYPEGHEKEFQMRPFDEIPLPLRQCITEIEFKHSEDRFGTPIVNTRVKTLDKMKAIEMYARAKNLYDPDRNKGGKIKFRIGFE